MSDFTDDYISKEWGLFLGKDSNCDTIVAFTYALIGCRYNQDDKVEDDLYFRIRDAERLSETLEKEREVRSRDLKQEHMRKMVEIFMYNSYHI